MDYGWLWMIKDDYGLVEGKFCRKPWISPPIHRYVSCKKNEINQSNEGTLGLALNLES